MDKKFLCDATCHRLARWLRFLGIDTEVTSEYRVHPLLRMVDKSGRILLTRNRKFVEEKNPRVYVLNSDFVFEELKEVIEQFNIKNPSLFTRCTRCNEVLKKIDKEKVKGKVPYFTYRHFDEFKICPRCDKIYWQGSHYELIKKRLVKEGIWEILFSHQKR